MQRMKKILLFTFIWLNICVSVWSVPNAIVEHYTVDQGLPNNIVNCTVKGKMVLSGSVLGMAFAALTG